VAVPEADPELAVVSATAEALPPDPPVSPTYTPLPPDPPEAEAVFELSLLPAVLALALPPAVPTLVGLPGD